MKIQIAPIILLITITALSSCTTKDGTPVNPLNLTDDYTERDSIFVDGKIYIIVNNILRDPVTRKERVKTAGVIVDGKEYGCESEAECAAKVREIEDARVPELLKRPEEPSNEEFIDEIFKETSFGD